MARRYLQNPRHLLTRALKLEDELETLMHSKSSDSLRVKELFKEANRCWKLFRHVSGDFDDLSSIGLRLKKIRVFKERKSV